MSATHNNPDQFKLFMTGTEWQAQVTHSTDGPMPSTWVQKEEEARAPKQRESYDPGPNQLTGGMYDHMKEHGYQRQYDEHEGGPTIIIEDAPNGKSTRMVQSEGHHRVAAAAAIERDTGKPVYIPTNYVDNSAAGRRAKRPSPQTYRPYG